MTPIVTLTVNPALDVGTSVPRVEPTHKLRCAQATVDAGGGGVNVARVIDRLGGRAVAIVAAGGATGDAYARLLDAEAVDARIVPIRGATRQSFTVDETESGDQFRFVLDGPELSEAECGAALDATDAALAEGGYLVASGSLPPGAPEDFYARVARRAKARGAFLAVDSSGEALRAALEEGVSLVKPNRRELALLTGESLDDHAAQARAASALVERGAAAMVALTLGAEGALLAWEGGVARLPAPEVERRSAVGAGDSFLAGFVFRLAQGRAPEEAFRAGVAAGAAALITPATELARAEDVFRLEEALAERP